MKKKLTALLLAAILSALAVGCSQPSAEEGKTGETSGNGSLAGEESAVEEDVDPFKQLPEKDYGGRTFTMLARSLYVNDQWAENITGDAYNDAVYDRNLSVEDRYNIDYAVTPIGGEWDQRSSFLNTVRSSVQAADGAYDLIEGYAATIGDGFSSHLYHNLNEISGLQLDRGWWSSLVKDELTINGRLFAITGDISVSLWNNMHVFFFHKDILKENDLESPYALVLEGKWTAEKFLSMIEGVALDLDGNGKINTKDRNGVLCADALALDNLHNAFGLRLTERDADGNVVLNLYNEKMVSTAELAYRMAYETPDFCFLMNSFNPCLKKFTEGYALFFTGLLENAAVMREMESDFGILPPPKYDEAQERYYTTSRDSRSMYAIPVDVKDTEFSGIITEALCVAGNQKVIPVYYDKVLKSKIARDEESGQMLDILRDGLILDFAAEYAVQTGRAGFIIRDVVEGRKEIASHYNQSAESWNKLFEDFLQPYYD